jgi:hypothetical protein
MHAALLGEALDAAVGDPVRAATLLDLGAREEIEPFYRASVAADLEASRRVGAVASSALDRAFDRFFHDGVLPASRTDPVVFRAFLRMLYMMETPEQAFFRPDVIGRSLAAWMRGARFRARVLPQPPDYDATVAACERAAGTPLATTAA